MKVGQTIGQRRQNIENFAGSQIFGTLCIGSAQPSTSCAPHPGKSKLQNVMDFGDAKCHRFFGCKMTGIFGMQNVTDFGNTNFYGFCDILILKSGLKLNISYEGKSWFEYLLGVKDLTFCIFDCSTSCWCTHP